VKNEILKLFNVSSEKIVVIYEGVRNIFRTNFDQKIRKIIKDKYALPDKFLLFVGTLEPKKNVDLILSVYEKLCENYPVLGLVLVGKKGWKIRKLVKRLNNLMKVHKIIVTGYIPVEDLAIIYSMAEMLIFPSLIEGFGIPPLESMASGTPVVTSNRGSIPEVVGEAAIKLDPYDYKAYYNSILNLLNNRDQRQELIQRGLIRSRQFSWKKTAEETLKVYESI
jgi:glycosyltransferase involved in cell wall biosynthesis